LFPALPVFFFPPSARIVVGFPFPSVFQRPSFLAQTSTDCVHFCSCTGIPQKNFRSFVVRNEDPPLRFLPFALVPIMSVFVGALLPPVFPEGSVMETFHSSSGLGLLFFDFPLSGGGSSFSPPFCFVVGGRYSELDAHSSLSVQV